MNPSDMMAHDQPRNDLALAEAALFLAPQPLTRRALAKILGDVAQGYVDQLLEDLKAQFDDSNRGIELHVEEGRAMFRVKAAYVNQVAHLAPQHDIPRQELRTLAVIAYNHPMTQADLIKVRGNKGYGHIQELIERRLITAEPQGRTLLLRVTREFLRHFGLSSVEEFRFHFPTAAQDEPDSDQQKTPNHQVGSIGDEGQSGTDQTTDDEPASEERQAVRPELATRSGEQDEPEIRESTTYDGHNELDENADERSAEEDDNG